MTARPDVFLPLYVADYLADTTDLTRDQHGAYLLLLMAYWRKGGPLPADDARLARIAKATAEEWQSLRSAMLDFFTEIDGKWVSKRSDQELSKAAKRIEAKAAAGKRGAEARWQRDGNRIDLPLANGMAKNGSSPSPSHISPKANAFGEGVREDAPPPRPIGRIAWAQEVPDQWHVTAAGQLKSLGLEPIETNTLAAKFTAHYRATGETRTVSEWQARFIKWAIDEARKPNGTAQRQPGKPDRKTASSIFLELGNGTRAAE